MKKKKGFTLVELLVVIAILAILASVAVVGYLSFTEKAKESNDEVLVTQLNHLLQADEVINGKPKKPSDAVEVLENNGFIFEKLVPSSSNNCFLYNHSTNRLEVHNNTNVEDAATINSNLWVIVQDEMTLEKMTRNYSILLSTNYVDSDNVININNGFDCSKIIDDYKIIYTNSDTSKEVIINTNGASLIINGKSGQFGDTVYHYGDSSIVTINSIGSNSYHELGNVNTLYLVEGRIKTELSARVNTIVVLKESLGKEVNVDVSKGEVNQIALDSNVDKNIVLGYDTNKILKATNVSTFEEFDAATWPETGQPSQYVILNNDINLKTSISIKKSIVIDGNDHKIQGHRTSAPDDNAPVKNYVTLFLSSDGSDLPSEDYSITIKNMTILNNSKREANVIGVNSYVKYLNIDNVVIDNMLSTRNSKGIFIEKGLHNSNSTLELNVTNSKILCNNTGYGVFSARSLNLNIYNSYVSGYGSVYLRNIAKNSSINLVKSNLDNPNMHSGVQDNFGAITLESGYVDVCIDSCYINALENAKAYQYVILLSDYQASNTSNVNVSIKGDTVAFGTLLKNCWSNFNNINVNITGGKFNVEPIETYIPNTHKIIREDVLYKVVLKQ